MTKAIEYFKKEGGGTVRMSLIKKKIQASYGQVGSTDSYFNHTHCHKNIYLIKNNKTKQVLLCIAYIMLLRPNH